MRKTILPWNSIFVWFYWSLFFIVQLTVNPLGPSVAIWHYDFLFHFQGSCLMMTGWAGPLSWQLLYVALWKQHWFRWTTYITLAPAHPQTLCVSICWHWETLGYVHFYPRPVLAFGYCHRPCLCICQCVCVCINHLLVRTITHQPFKLESPNLKHRCKTPWLRCLLFWGVIDLELQGQI